MNRAVYILLAGAWVSSVGTWMERLAVGVFVAEKTGQAGWTGTVTGMLFVPVLFVGPLGGVLADRFERRNYIVILALLQSAIAFTIFGLASTHHLSIGTLSWLMFFTGSASVCMSSAFNGILAHTVALEELPKAVFLNGAQWNLARVVGPALAAVTLATTSISTVFLLNAMSFLAVAAASLQFAKTKSDASALSFRAVKVELLVGLNAARRTKTLRRALFVMAALGGLVAPFIGLLPAIAKNVLHVDSSKASWLLALQGVGAVIAALIVPRVMGRAKKSSILTASTLAVGILCILFWASSALLFSLAVILPLGAFYFAASTGIRAMAFQHVTPGSHSRIASLCTAVLDGSYAFGLSLVGWLGDALGLRYVGIAVGVIFLIIFIIARTSKYFDVFDLRLPQPQSSSGSSPR